MRIYLIRHGESNSNVDSLVLRDTDDKNIGLTATGRMQSGNLGEWLGRQFKNVHASAQNISLWGSEYERARQTAALAKKMVRKSFREITGIKLKTKPELNELSLGKFAGYDFSDRAQRFPKEHDAFQKQWDEGLGYYARHLDGESHADVGERLVPLVQEIHELEKRGITDLVIFGHSATNRVLTHLLSGKDFNDLNREPRSGNCHVRLLEMAQDGITQDKGYIYTGQLLEHATGM